jgi:hypothetical protein
MALSTNPSINLRISANSSISALVLVNITRKDHGHYLGYCSGLATRLADIQIHHLSRPFLRAISHTRTALDMPYQPSLDIISKEVETREYITVSCTPKAWSSG